MINLKQRQKDILSIIENLDISPSMYHNAVEKYKAIASYLSEQGIKADFYPQGSFALGTVIRPKKSNQTEGYDFDVICQVVGDRDLYSPSELRAVIKDALEKNKTYKDRLTIYENCFTIEYADISGISFSLDIVPSVEESITKKEELRQKSSRPDLIREAIAIPQQNSLKSYQWITNNPKGYKKWFDEINAPYLEATKIQERSRIFESNRMIYSSIEEVPQNLQRSALQRVIQILKAHRNQYYALLPDGDEIRPISAIITTLCSRIAVDQNPDLAVFDLLHNT